MAHVFPLQGGYVPADLPQDHLEAGEVAGYLDRALSAEARARVEDHLDQCEVCRAEVIQVARLVRTARRRRPVAVPVGLAAAAVLALLLTPSIRLPTRPEPEFREPGITAAPSPAAIAPRGDVGAVRELIWSQVPRAGRYRVVLLDVEGALMWRTETTDTVVILPDSLRLRAREPYFWRVEAETAFGRWVASDLVDFVIGGRNP
jgi:hypothetical protein